MDEWQEHIQALRQWLATQGQAAAQPTRLSAEDRQRLQKINKAIEQLSRLGIAIPGELLEQQQQLAAQDRASEDTLAHANRRRQLEAVVEALQQLLAEALALKRQWRGADRPADRKAGTKHYYGVRLEELMQTGYLAPEDQLELQWQKNGPVFQGKVQKNGTVLVKTDRGWQTYKSLSTAASKQAGRPLNGWDHWSRLNADGSRTRLREIREQFLRQKKRP